MRVGIIKAVNGYFVPARVNLYSDKIPIDFFTRNGGRAAADESVEYKVGFLRGVGYVAFDEFKRFDSRMVEMRFVFLIDSR